MFVGAVVVVVWPVVVVGLVIVGLVIMPPRAPAAIAGAATQIASTPTAMPFCMRFIAYSSVRSRVVPFSFRSGATAAYRERLEARNAPVTVH